MLHLRNFSIIGVWSFKYEIFSNYQIQPRDSPSSPCLWFRTLVDEFLISCHRDLKTFCTAVPPTAIAAACFVYTSSSTSASTPTTALIAFGNTAATVKSETTLANHKPTIIPHKRTTCSGSSFSRKLKLQRNLLSNDYSLHSAWRHAHIRWDVISIRCSFVEW